MKANILRANFTIQANCPMQNYFESTERKSTPLTTEEVHNFLRSQQQANRQSRKQLFRMNCPIINLRNKQTVLRRKFFQKSRIHRGSKARKPASREEHKVRYKCFLRGSRVVRSEITDIPLCRINCSAVSTSVLFEETKLSTNTSSQFTVQFIQIIKLACV